MLQAISPDETARRLPRAKKKQTRATVHPDVGKQFVCSEESDGYALNLQRLLFDKLQAVCASPTIIEFGSGTGEPIISAILNSGFQGTVHGYEINAEAARAGNKLIDEHGLARQYVIHNTSFFDVRRIPPADYLIANPPYIPADNDQELILPYLCGGSEGNMIAKRLLSAGYKNICLEISSYSSPADQLQHAAGLGYKLTRFLVTQLPLGVYSRQPIVMQRIRELQSQGKAHLSHAHYNVGSAFFTKARTPEPNLAAQFFAALTAV